MSTKVSPTLIGAFVVGALALLIVAVIAFGSGQLFRKTQEFILYFDGSVNGLRIGGPVKIKGVEIGSVKDIKLETELGSQIHKIPVIIEIDLKKVIRRGVSREEAMDPNTIREFIKQGLRGQLQTESLVTGVLYVGLDWFPETPIRFVQPLKSILQSVDQAMPQLRGAISDFRTLTATANNNVTNVSADLHQTLTAAHSAIEQIAATMKEAETTIISVRATVDPNSPTFYELTKSLREVSGAASSIRLLADSLDRNPQAAILGKPETPKGK